MNRILSMVFLFAVLVACKKDPQEAQLSECLNSNIGYVSFFCESSNPYNIYIDGSFKFTVSGNSVKIDYPVSAGDHYFKMVQKSGFAIYPTIRESDLFVKVCKHYSFTFP